MAAEREIARGKIPLPLHDADPTTNSLPNTTESALHFRCSSSTTNRAAIQLPKRRNQRAVAHAKEPPVPPSVPPVPDPTARRGEGQAEQGKATERRSERMSDEIGWARES